METEETKPNTSQAGAEMPETESSEKKPTVMNLESVLPNVKVKNTGVFKQPAVNLNVLSDFVV